MLADLLSEVIDFEPDMKIVALPTIGKHIRERGFDHTWSIARKIARINGLEAVKALKRGNNTVQVGSNREERQEQAKTAYIANDSINKDANYLLIDDVWTTGSIIMTAAKKLREAGCKKISVAVVAKSD